MKPGKFFKDKKGKIVIGQRPNWPIWLAILFWVIKFNIGMTVTLIYWAYLEITEGVNSFRKTLGVLVLVYELYQLLIYFNYI